MASRPAVLVVAATVLAVHLAFYPGTYHVGEVKSFVFLAAVAALVGALAAERRAEGEPVASAFAGRLPRHVFGATAVYVLVAVLSVAWATYRVAAGFRAVEVALLAGWMLLVVRALGSRRDVARGIDAFLLAGVLAAAAAFLAWPLSTEQAKQFFLPMSNSNWLGVAMLIPMMLCVEGFVRNVAHPPSGVVGASSGVSSADEKKKPQPGAAAPHKKQSHPWAGVPHKMRAALFAAAFALMAATLVMAGSQSSAAAFAAGLVALPVLAGARLPRKDSGQGKWLIAAAVAGVLALACAGDLALGSHSRLRAFAASKSVDIRLKMWRWGVTLAERNPVSGLGAGGYFPHVGEVAAPDFDANPNYWADLSPNAHNEPLEVFVELGVFGLAAFLWPVAVCLWGVARLPRDDPGDALRGRLGAFAAGWLAVLLQSLFDVGMRFESVPVTWWTGLAVLVAGLRPGLPASDPRPPSIGVPRGWRLAVSGLVALAAAWVCVTGLRASIAMKDALDAPDAEARMRLLQRAAADEVIFVDRVRATNALGKELERAESWGAASDEYREVLRLAGFYHDTETRLARTLLEQDRVDEAMTLLMHYADLRPADASSADVLLGWLGGRPAGEAMDRINALLTRHSDFSKLYVAAGRLALHFSPPNEDKARGLFARALRVNPRDAHAAYLLGFYRLKEGTERLNPELTREGRQLISDAYRRGFRSPELYVNLARIRRAVGDAREADDLLREGAAMFPTSKDIQAELDASQRAGD